MKNVSMVSVFALLFVATPAFAQVQVVFPTSPESVVWQAPGQVCEEIIYTYSANVSGATVPMVISDFSFDIQNEQNQTVTSVTYGNILSLSPADTYATGFETVGVPCLSALTHSLYSDDYTVSANETEDVTFKIFYTPEVAGTYRAVMTGIAFDSTGSGAKNNGAKGGAGRCLNCAPKTEQAVLGASISASSLTATIEKIVADKKLNLTDAEMQEILAFMKLLVSLELI